MIGGIELGGTKCIAAVAESPDNILVKKRILTKDPNSTFSELISFFKNYEIESLGIGSFGPIVLDSKSEDYGILVAESKEGWNGVNVVNSLSNISKNIIIDTDVNAAALGEHKYGAGKSSENFVYVTIGTGIGVGVLINGKPNVGNFHLEIGHMFIPNNDNSEGVCRIHGNCWEGLASGPAIHTRWGVQAEKLPLGHEAWEIEAQLLAFGIVNIISNYSPDKIVLGGGVMNQQHLFEMVRLKVEEIWNGYTPLGSLSDLILEPALGNDSGIVGSLSLAL
ncbi:MAG: ROK family protein [Candidatus Thermoplasmatota archaeon]|jgi:fructokinase|nr:ROK family protein [Candidatus Thermoplasmatota archaeon]